MLIKQTPEMTARERLSAENSNNQYLQALSYVAVGTIYPYAGTVAPDTFMFCDGSELDKTEYAELFEVIGYTYGGSGDTFNIPDLRGRTLVGYNDSDTKFDTVGKKDGEAEHTLKVSEIPSHGHQVLAYCNYGGSELSAAGKFVIEKNEYVSWQATERTGLNRGLLNTTEPTGSGQPHNNMPPYIVTNFIIKVMQGSAACELGFVEAINNAVKQNFDEAVEAGTIKGETGDSGVYVGSEEPTDENVIVWVDPDGEESILSVTVKETESGHTVSISTPNDTKSFEVLNGKDGAKGDKGDKGDTGAQGEKGTDGYTPVKGVDYWTDDEQEELLTEVDTHISEQLADRTQLTPEFANSILECTDTTKLYVLPDGYIYAYYDGESEPEYENQIPLSIDLDGTLYNDGKGYADGVRFSASSIAFKEDSTKSGTGLIKITKGDIIRFKNLDIPSLNGSDYYLAVTNTEFSTAWSLNDSSTENLTITITDGIVTEIEWLTGGNYYFALVAPSGAITDDSVITINQEIVENISLTGWQSTGHAFVPADYEDRILALEQALKGDLDIYGIVDGENNVVMTGSLIPGTYALKYQNSDGSTTDIGTFEIS